MHWSIRLSLFLVLCWTSSVVGEVGIRHLEGESKVVYLTFDDGPHPVYTAEVMTILNRHKVRGTFFFLAKKIELYPELAKAVFRSGHSLGNHSFHHLNYNWLEPAGIKEDLKLSQFTFKQTFGHFPRYFRPPFGRLNESKAKWVHPYFKSIVLWDVDASDWKENATIESTVLSVISNIKPGSIVLFHDTNPNVVGALPIILKWLKANDYRVGNLDEALLGK